MTKTDVSDIRAKQKKLDQIKADIAKNKVCPDLAKTAKHMVFGAGSPNAQILFIGEAPGKNEDLQGLPFVGAAGRFLNEMLAMIGLERSDIYITNIVKYRPPNNRDPEPAEKAAFLPYLQQQIEAIRPKLVVPLGRHSMNCFLPELQISKVHGQAKRIRLRLGAEPPLEIVMLPLFHPAAALYNNSMRQTLIDDFAQIPAIMKKITT